MTSVVVWSNFTNATLASGISSSATTLTLTSGQGAEFPSPGSGQFFPVTLQSASNATTVEIAYCTARSSDTLTVTRGQESTSAQAFNAGDLVQLRPTAGALASYGQLGATQTWTGENSFPNITTVGNTGGYIVPASAILNAQNSEGITAQFYNDTSEPDTSTVCIETSRTDGSLVGWFFGYTNIASVTTNGSTITYGVGSDYRIKIIYGPGDGTWLSKLPIHDGAYKADSEKTRLPVILAHELAALAPWAVRGEKDGVDKHGKMKIQQVDWFAMMPSVVGYIQSLERGIQELQARLAALEGAPR